jgi:tetratricopeptide (TPR) repeat protein
MAWRWPRHTGLIFAIHYRQTAHGRPAGWAATADFNRSAHQRNHLAPNGDTADVTDSTDNSFKGAAYGPVVQSGHIDNVVVNPGTPEPKKALAGLPRATTDFVGRSDELHDLRATWSEQLPSVVCSAVGGLAGVGKTELVLHAAQQAIAEGEFPGGTLFVDLQGYDDERRVDPPQALETFLRALGISHIPPEAHQRELLYRTVLSEHPRMLIVLDNASSAAQVKPLLPGRPGHCVLITSRHTLSGLDGVRHIDIGTLSEADSTQLVGDRDLARLCGHLPLALRIMAALRSTFPEVDWVTELKTARDRLEVLDDGDSRAVHAAFALSYRALRPDQQRLFRLLAEHPGDEITFEGAVVLADTSEHRIAQTLRELRRAHLLEPSRTSGYYQFHDLVRLYAVRCFTSDPDDKATTRVLNHFLSKTEAADQEIWCDGKLGVFADRQQALQWLDRHRATLVAAVTMASGSRHHKIAIRLSVALRGFLSFRKRGLDRLEVSRSALDSAVVLQEPQVEADALIHLGEAYLELNRTDEANETLIRALDLSRDIGYRHGETCSLTCLGISSGSTGHNDVAITCFEQSLAIDRELSDRSGEAHTLGNLAVAYTNAKRFDWAIATLHVVQKVFHELGDKHNEGLAFNNLGIAHMRSDHFHEAVRHFSSALKVRRQIHDRYGLGQTMYNLGLCYYQMGWHDHASNALRAAVTAFQDIGSDSEVEDALNAITTLIRLDDV